MEALGEKLVDFDAALERPTMATVGGNDAIVAGQCSHRSDRDRLLAGAEVQRAGHRGRRRRAQREAALLESADGQHPPVGQKRGQLVDRYGDAHGTGSYAREDRYVKK